MIAQAGRESNPLVARRACPGVSLYIVSANLHTDCVCKVCQQTLLASCSNTPHPPDIIASLSTNQDLNLHQCHQRVADDTGLDLASYNTCMQIVFVILARKLVFQFCGSFRSADIHTDVCACADLVHRCNCKCHLHPSQQAGPPHILDSS